MKADHFVTQYVERDPATGEARLVDVPAAEWPAWTAELRRASVEPVTPRPAAFRMRAKGWWKRKFGRPSIQLTDLRPESLSNLAWILADAARRMKTGELRYASGGIGLIQRGGGFYLTADLTVEDGP